MIFCLIWFHQTNDSAFPKHNYESSYRCIFVSQGMLRALSSCRSKAVLFYNAFISIQRIVYNIILIFAV